MRLFSLATFVFLALVVYDRYVPKSPPPLPPLTVQSDHILIEKAARRLTVFREGTPLRSYKIALGFAPDGDKAQQGDGKTPEGIFKVNRRNGESKFHLSLGLDYPRPDDLARARTAGINPGGDIFIHGQPNGMDRLRAISYDWTAGCIAISNHEIEELWRMVGIGTTVEIKP